MDCNASPLFPSLSASFMTWTRGLSSELIERAKEERVSENGLEDKKGRAGLTSCFQG